jgi:hypothetical protein
MSFRLEFRSSVKKDILLLLEWYLDKSVSNAEKFQIQLEEAKLIITKQPYSFQIRYKEVRMSHLKNFPVSLHYVINEKLKIVTLIAVLSSKQDSKK